jgi:hypothetical protein
VRGILILVGLIVGLLLLGFGLVKLIALPFGGIGATAWFYGFVLICVALGGLAIFGRRKQKKALAARSAQQTR